jgi:hypothetical protein
MKKQIVKTLIGLLIGIILVIILKVASSNGIRFDDFIPLIGIVIYFGYQNYMVIKEERDIVKTKIEAINNNQVFAYDNILISKSENDNNLIKVRNDLFWFDLKQKRILNDTDLLDSLIEDFKKMSSKNSSFKQLFSDKIIEFSLIDNVNFDSKILIQKSIGYNELIK